jgi:transposase
MRRLVFLDETSLNTKMVRQYGRSPRGQRCPGLEPHGHWHCSTFIGALRHDRIDAPMLLDGAMNGAAFLAYIQQALVPTLVPGDLVICDNLASHKVAGVAQALEAVGAKIHYLPPYSPDLNPIEMAFAKLKSHLRHAKARTFPKLLRSVAKALDQFSPTHCTNFLTHAQYS